MLIIACLLRARWPVGLAQLSLDGRADNSRDKPVALSRPMLIDQRCARRAMTHPAQQLSETGAGTRRDVVARMAEIMKVKTGQPR